MKSGFNQIMLASLPAVLLFSCAAKRDQTVPLLRMLNADTEISTDVISGYNNQIINSLEQKTMERESKDRSLHWYRKAVMVRQASDSMLNYIKKMREDLLDEPGWIADAKKRDFTDTKKVYLVFISTGRGKDLFIKFTNYRDRIFDIDSMIKEQFAGSVDPGNSAFFDSAASHNFPEKYFSNANIAEGLAYLAIMKSRVVTEENRILSFCLDQSSPPLIHDYFGPDILLSLSSSYVKPGEPVTLNVLIGDYAPGVNAIVQVNRRSKKIKNDGTDGILIKAPGKAGKYTIPVKISFEDERGKTVTTERTVSYEVAKSRN